MTVKEIQESGLIEYYVLGLLSEKEIAQVRGYLEQFPELQNDYDDIQSAVQMYAKTNGVVPRKDFSKDITQYIKSNSENKIKSDNSSNNKTSDKPKTSTPFKLLSIVFGIATLGLIALFINKNNAFQELEKSKVILENECDSIQNEQANTLSLYESLNSEENNSLLFTPTENYQTTKLIFHNNKISKKNFIQIQNLPEINRDQAFQLWSLKDGVDPIPLTVFKNGGDYIVPVDFEEGTQTYAITIENESGAQVPTLTRLIGTVGV